MIPLESKLVSEDLLIDYMLIPSGVDLKKYERYVDGYFLTIDQLKELVRDFQVDSHDGFVSNDKAYIEEWLKKH